VRDETGDKKQCYMRMIELYIDGESQIDNPKLVWHNSPMIIERQVKDGDMVDVSILLEHI